MKKTLLLLGAFAIVFASCGEKKKEEAKPEKETTVETVKEEVKTEATVDSPELIAKGKELFTSKTCATCHQPDTKVIGPSIKDINKVYTEKNADIVKFLKEESPAIVDTDPGQVAIMKANLDGFVKNLTDDELHALSAYMRSVN